jgi:acyl-CoA thioesterase YciA
VTDNKGEPILRVVPRPGDINANGHIFGGWVLSQMDIAAGIVASRRAEGPVATVAIEAMKFIGPILLLDVISVYARIERTGPTSMGIRIEVVASRNRGTEEVKVTEALFTFVALDEENRPAPAALVLCGSAPPRNLQPRGRRIRRCRSCDRRRQP